MGFEWNIKETHNRSITPSNTAKSASQTRDIRSFYNVRARDGNLNLDKTGLGRDKVGHNSGRIHRAQSGENENENEDMIIK